MSKKQSVAFPGFDKCMAMLRNRKEAMTQEEGYYWLQPRAAEYVEPLITELAGEQDPYILGWILELLGEARSTTAFPVLVTHVLHPDASLREWALSGLKKLHQTRAGRQVLWGAYLHGVGLPELPTQQAYQAVRDHLEQILRGKE